MENITFFGILEAFDGSIWIGSGSGVHRFDGRRITSYTEQIENRIEYKWNPFGKQ